MIAQLKSYLKTLIETHVPDVAVYTEQEEQKRIKSFPAALISFGEEPLTFSRMLVDRRFETGKVIQTHQRAIRRQSVLLVFAGKSEDAIEDVDGYEEIFLREVMTFNDPTANENYRLMETASAELVEPPSQLRKQAKKSLIVTYEKGVFKETDIGAIESVDIEAELV